MHAQKMTRGKQGPVASRRVRGIALIEVLVAMLIFLLGVIGLVGLQAAMTRAQTEAKFRADAAMLANDVVGRMWSDLTGMASYSGSGCASQARCKEWQNKVANNLPAGTGALVVDAPTGDVEVTVTWTMPNGETHKYVTHTTVAKAGG
ncbi:type IV pilus modification PilV family protein [Variovorax sp. GT1P44]|uniref:type IV pilus modification PilV family protein n=1 Tax=Variovorax sp. GT1P44 TaxID=3443742 RepID=UPI003F44B0E9